jgi:hypothetical protein
MAKKWQGLKHQPSFNADTMLLLTDGTVMCHALSSPNWHRLAPDEEGSYLNGEWTQLKGLPENSLIPASVGGPKNAPLYFASAVLADGRVFTAGGEYNEGKEGAETLAVQVYDPLADEWTTIPPPPGFTQIGDGESCVLPDGRVLLCGSSSGSNLVAIFDPVLELWTAAAEKGESPSEETFTLMPDGTILTVACSNIPHAEKYVIGANEWVPAGETPSTLPQECPGDVPEIGPALLLPDGRVFAVGATGNTALYKPPANPTDAGKWEEGPKLVDNHGNTQYPMDAPGVLLPNGNVVCCGGPTPPCEYEPPTTFFEFEPATNKLNVIESPANGGRPCYRGRFLLLPNGQVLFSNNTEEIQVYIPDGAPEAEWKPTITSSPKDMVAGHTYQIAGAQLNGLSQAVCYGDDAQMATNYPIARLESTSSSKVVYLRTAGHSTMGVATGKATHTTNITIPKSTPPGDYNLVIVANGIASEPERVTIAVRDCYFLLERSTFSQGEIKALINLEGEPARVDPALFLVVEGFSAAELGLTASNLAKPPHPPSIPSPLHGVSFELSGPVVPEDPSLPPTPQRFAFPFRISFENEKVFDFAASVEALALTASLTASGSTVSSTATIELIKNPNPFILHGAAAETWYLSVDIRVLQVKAGERRFAANMTDTGEAPHDATKFIKEAIGNLNESTALTSEFDALPLEEQEAALSLAPEDSSGTSIYNFALARVRYRDTVPAENVRLFFRIWPAQQTNATYEPATYPSGLNPHGERVPLLGVRGDEIATIPCFASPRVKTTSEALTNQEDPTNVREIKPDPLGGEVDVYYGCWLDINQPGEKILPARLVAGAGTIPNGPFNSSAPLFSIQELVRSQHQCLLAEISFDPDPIPVGVDPSDSDKLAQRNLAFVEVPNPGALHSRLAPQTFEVRPTPAGLTPGLPLDELMIEWGNTPAGAGASVFLPEVSAAEVLAIADRTYTSHRLSATDAHTIGCPTGGVTYIPIPRGGETNFAGLLTVQLPSSVHRGDRYGITVRQVTSVPGRREVVFQAARTSARRQTKAQAAALRQEAEIAARGWRRVLGIFRLAVPVGVKSEMLEPEERLLAILKSIARAIPYESRWYPVFVRYLEQVEARVGEMGGNPILIPPSPVGQLPPGLHLPPGGGRGGHGHGPGHEHGGEHTGKVAALLHDRFGDFEGFVLRTWEGERHFAAREREIERVLTRAWEERFLITVVSEPHDHPEVPVRIIVRGHPGLEP